MVGDIPLIKTKLENINKRINKIEDEDANYGSNTRWKELDRLRDKLYAQLAELEAKNEKHSISGSNTR